MHSITTGDIIASNQTHVKRFLWKVEQNIDAVRDLQIWHGWITI
nr:MAG TPA: hypothetical protein [Caudoviricetes sp.]